MTATVLLVGDLDSVHVQRLARGLRDSAIEVRVAGFGEQAIEGVEVHDLGARRSRRNVRYLRGIVPLARLIRRRRPQIVHAHFLTSFGLMATLAMWLAFPLGRRSALVQTVWGTDLLVTARQSRIHAILARLTLRSADLVTGDSGDLEAEARRLAPGTPFHRFRFGPSASLLGAGRRPEPLIVSSRRLDDDTRIELIVMGFREAKNRTTDLSEWQLIVAGDGRRAEHLRTMAAGRRDVQFTGQLTAEELKALLLRANVFISIPRSDGTSAALLEAMAAGVAPIVSDLPANREWVDPEVGYVLPHSPTVGDVATAIETLSTRANDPDAVRARVADATWESELERLVIAYGTIGPVRPAAGRA